MTNFAKFMTAAICSIAAGLSLAGKPSQQYQAYFVHRYPDAAGSTSWDVAGITHVSVGQDGSDVGFPNEVVFFISLSADGKAHVFFHGKDMRGSTWLHAERTFNFDPDHVEEIVLQDQSKLDVGFNSVP